jgi:WD40 repeat protein
LILGYFQLFYQPKIVDGGIVKESTVFTTHTSKLRGVRFSPNGEMVFSSSVDSTIRIWKKETGEVIGTLKHPAGVTSIDISPDGNYIVSGSYDALVRLWRVQDGLLLKEFKGHRGTVWSVAFAPDGKSVASSGDDEKINLWDTRSGELIRPLHGHKRTIWSVKFSPDGKYVASAGYDESIKIWDLSNGNLVKTNNEHIAAIVDIAYNYDGSILASTSDDKTIKLWKMPGMFLIRSISVVEHVQAAAFSPDGKRLVTAGRDKAMIGEFLQEIFGDSEFNKGVSMRLWEVQSGKLLQTFTVHSNDVNDVAYSRDGEWIASASEDNTVRIWRVIN